MLYEVITLAAGRTVDVSPDLGDLIRRSVDLEQRTGGRFNPAIGRLTELWGFNDLLQPDWRPPSPAAVAALVDAGLSGEQLYWQDESLGSRSTAVMLDLGGIAKGVITSYSIHYTKLYDGPVMPIHHDRRHNPRARGARSGWSPGVPG